MLYNNDYISNKLFASDVERFKKKKHPRVYDYTIIPKRVEGNIFYLRQIQKMQDFRNNNLERERLTGYLAKKIPAVQKQVIEDRIKQLEKHREKYVKYIDDKK